MEMETETHLGKAPEPTPQRKKPLRPWQYLLIISLLLNIFFISWAASRAIMFASGYGHAGPPLFISKLRHLPPRSEIGQNEQKSYHEEHEAMEDYGLGLLKSSPEVMKLMAEHGPVLQSEMRSLRNNWRAFIKIARKAETESDRQAVLAQLESLNQQSDKALEELHKAMIGAVTTLPPPLLAEIVNRRLVHYHGIFDSDRDD